MSNDDLRFELVIPIPADVTTLSRHYAGAQPDEKVLVGTRRQLGRMLITALAAVTEDPLLAELDTTEFTADSLALALRALGHAAAIGVDTDPHKELGMPSVDVTEHLGSVWGNVAAGECGWCGETGHKTRDCTSELRAEFGTEAGQ